MKLPGHGRYDYVPITKRPIYDWPEGKRLAVFFCNNIEHFAFGRGLGSDSTGADVAQNQRNYAWAKRLAAIDHVTLDDDVIFAAAYLHDVGSMKGWEVKGQEHGETAAAKLDRMLAGTDFPKAKMDRVREAMRTHMFYREAGPSPEARYLHDADALDNVGTVGLALVLENVDTKEGSRFTSQKAIEVLNKIAPKIEQGAVTPAGKAEMATRIAERKAFLAQLSRETDNFKNF